MMAMKARCHNQTSLHKAKVPTHDPLCQVCSIKKKFGGEKLKISKKYNKTENVVNFFFFYNHISWNYALYIDFLLKSNI